MAAGTGDVSDTGALGEAGNFEDIWHGDHFGEGTLVAEGEAIESSLRAQSSISSVVRLSPAWMESDGVRAVCTSYVVQS